MITSISISDLLKINNPEIIDIRSNESYNNNHIPGAKNISTEKIILDPKKYLNFYTNYYFYCQKGISSQKLCQLLQRRGYKAISVIDGYESWVLRK